MMKYILISLLLLCCNGMVKGQIYTSVEKQAEFPGGQEALIKFVMTNVSYTKEDMEKEGPQKTRNLRFVIDSTGKVTAPIIENKKTADYTSYDKRLIAMIYKMPKWRPAEQDKKNVSVSFMLPVRLSFQED